jgi:hypothetical protein
MMEPKKDDKERTVLAMAYARMWQDPQYKKQFIADPKTTLDREGVNFPADTSVKVVEEAPNIRYVDLAEDEEALRRLLPLPEGQEIRIVQSTANLRYLVLPPAPGWIAPGMTREIDLLKLSEKLPPTIVSETSVIGAQETVQVDESVVAETSESFLEAVHTSMLIESSEQVQVVVEVQTSELVVIDSQAIEAVQVEVETSVAEVVAMT